MLADHRGMPQITDLSVEFISLVKRPANGRRIVLRGATGGAREFAITKADALLHRVYGVVYAPDSVDAQGDWADAETIRRAADEWMRSGRAEQVDHEHGFVPLPAFVAESWIVRAGDALFPDEKPGAWAVGIQIEDAALWDAIEAGDVQGISLAGTARLQKWQGAIARIFRKENDMTADEVRAIVKEALEQSARRADEEAAAARLAKSMQDVEALTKAAQAQAEALAKLAERVEALEKAPATKPGSPEGEHRASPQASFV